MKTTYSIYKNLGETPLEALVRLRAEEHIPASVPMTYAGRLDPAAEGELIILAGDECKKKEKYTKLGKTYVAEIVLGVSTDSYDLLGMPKMGAASDMTIQKTGELFAEAEEWIKKQLGKKTQKYPPYSSKTVEGVQLHAHAREGKEVKLPTHEVEFKSYVELSVRPKKKEEVVKRVELVAQKVTGDFRQKEIVEAWKEVVKNLPDYVPIVKVTIEVGSGFYVRQLAEDMGEALGTAACLYSLVRTKINSHH